MNKIFQLNDALDNLLAHQPRFKKGAYLFVLATLTRATQKYTRPRHVSGQELLGQIRRQANECFGPMAATVFEHWGVKNALDFGEIVFNMVQEGILFKTEEDCLSDFDSKDFLETLFDPKLNYRLKESENLLEVSKRTVTQDSFF